MTKRIREIKQYERNNTKENEGVEVQSIINNHRVTQLKYQESGNEGINISSEMKYKSINMKINKQIKLKKTKKKKDKNE